MEATPGTQDAVSTPGLAPLRPADPERVREYRLTARLGEGGQGTVYLGESSSGTQVAVKLLRAELAQDEEARERFVREVGTARRVSPFCTAAVLETGLDEGRPYIVSEYVEGPTLDAVVNDEGPREGAALHRLAIGTVTALVAIHQAGIMHRDFKPSNVLLAPDGPRVIDFGIAKALDQTSTLTAMAIGTPAYMTPEQLVGENAGSPADMFAWGCTMVFAATGRPPFGVDSLPAIFNRIMNVEPDLSAITDPVLRELVGDCLAKKASRRPTASEALMRLLGHAVPGAPAPSLPSTGGMLAEGMAAVAGPDAPARSPYRAGVTRPAVPAEPAHQAGVAWGAVRQESPYGTGAPVPGYQEPHRPVPGHPEPYPPVPGHPEPYPPVPGHPEPYRAGLGDHPPHQEPYRVGPGGEPPFQAGPGGYPSHRAGPGEYPQYQAGPVEYPPFQAGPGDRPSHQVGPGGYPSPYGLVTHPVAPGAAPSRSGRRRVRRAWIAIGAGLVLTLVAATITIVARGTGTPASDNASRATAGASGGATTAPTPAPTPTPALAPERRITLPGGSLTVRERETDPIKLTSYTLGTGDKYRLHTRKAGTRRFVKNDRYGHYTLDSTGTRALTTARVYNAAGYEVVSIVDHASGASTADIRVTKSPIFGLYPLWSPDGTKGLVTLYKTVPGKNESRVHGYTIIDVATKKASIVPVKEEGTSEWPYFWRADGRAVGTWTAVGGDDRIRFRDLRGTLLRTVKDVGAPIWIEGESLNPSGTLMITYCAEAEEICLRSATAVEGGEPTTRIPFETERIIGWYDDRHLAVWRERGSGHEAVVIDFRGEVKRVIATSKETDEDYKWQFMVYSRTTG
ncbi:serine/threonine protein kinase [Streptosporangium sp. DT93]|uniref:serine/threonine protein kinase n=1 Tax=Streptosporangium sp. DT93 TaxID=3393428 RepID=UPI003CF83162